MRQFTELEFQLDDGRMCYFDYTYEMSKSLEGSDADGRRGQMETMIEGLAIENVFVELANGDSGTKIEELHPVDQVEVMEQVEKYLSKWVPNE